MEVAGLPDDKDAHGLIHADVSDGNRCVDYTDGRFTVFDFDDAAFCWFMDAYVDTVLGGYAREHALPDQWLKRLPTFLKLVEMESLLSDLRDVAINGCDAEDDGALAYLQTCIEEDVPYLGFFDSIYSPRHQFQLSRPV